MEASILIVSRNRYAELQKTLEIVQSYIEKERHEIIVFLDGCTDGSEELKLLFPNVIWEISEVCVGASKARSILYKKANGKILLGFDDDSHPIQPDFIKIADNIFANNSTIGILAFKEVKGRFAGDDDIPLDLYKEKEDFLVKDFLGCGFAIKKEIYNKTRGFPVWVDIYGEEVCVSIETLNLGFDILFTHQIAVNHRTDKQKMNTGGANYFRFGKQLKNTASFYIVYYPFPLVLKKLGRLYYLNFIKYAVKDFRFLKEYFNALGANIFNIKYLSTFRKPLPLETIKKFNELQNPLY